MKVIHADITIYLDTKEQLIEILNKILNDEVPYDFSVAIDPSISKLGISLKIENLAWANNIQYIANLLQDDSTKEDDNE